MGRCGESLALLDFASSAYWHSSIFKLFLGVSHFQDLRYLCQPEDCASQYSAGLSSSLQCKLQVTGGLYDFSPLGSQTAIFLILACPAGGVCNSGSWTSGTKSSSRRRGRGGSSTGGGDDAGQH